ncbi:probable sodium/metabolite cotransporter BASS4, chloroplastic [Dendronephthya gigantea]|uniref:probable sodium/metabolite cotransporter BASS4, chloroplastic n=1 Tax=Dendronephthya gigantea TaxID=151771 RepID=UPI001069ED97|nr:probable sodium/metabolite cotransporter BASS4, chloroplastic [Dendronephthya gigantea]
MVYYIYGPKFKRSVLKSDHREVLQRDEDFEIVGLIMLKRMSMDSVSTEDINEKKPGRFKMFLHEKLLPLMFKQFMMLGIIIALFVGLVFPRIGAYVGSFEGSTYICIIMVFLHSGVKLKTAAMKDAIKEYKAFIWGLISIVLITTIIGTKLTQLLPFGESVANYENKNHSNETSGENEESIVGPREFLIGLEIYYISPCAVASGIVLVSLAGGDVPIALLLTVTTNILGVVTVPLLATWLVSVKGVKISAVTLLIKLAITVLIPLVVGKVSTCITHVKTFVQDHTKLLKILSITFLVCIPWMKVSKAKLDGSFRNVSILNLVIVFFWGLALHLVMIVVNYVGAWLIRVSLKVRKTLVVLASTKTLAITLSVITFLPPELGDAGLMSLPLIVMHLALLLIDSAWVVRWNTGKGEEDDTKESGESCIENDDIIPKKNDNIDDNTRNHITAV